ncbi:YqhG family protein [Paenibacillus allorhizosphaerae]|uniref:Uncharacterized protein n=1 Tax=Paenibacillus allorhizosphaerae TaxID=2849866 RepID=A0ABN7TQA1_9BACL|nr:YqhG family protein [Paenibacillus allorhizosphaerae]CAG7651025.1 hypothetical protein PAECIP111802_04868 [Paenibacillus allorhizosphaerae]
MMTTEEIRSFVLKYLEAEKCDILEKHPAYVTVKLSVSADKDLTHRPYYWGFVERTGVTPETMTCTYIFDPIMYRELQPHSPQGGPAPGISTAAPPGMSPAPAPAPAQAEEPAAEPAADKQQASKVPDSPQPQGDSILGRYFGFVPTTFTARIPRDELTYGSGRLEQIFGAVRAKGRFVRLFEQYAPDTTKHSQTVPYESWLGVNYKVELACDMKRSEIHSIGIQLQTGEIREQFHDWVLPRRLTPRLPAHVYVTPDRIALPRAVLFLEQHLEQKLAAYDHSWAQQAQLRLEDEQIRVKDYYESLLQAAEPDKKPVIEAQYAGRLQEVDWQYRPRIQISAINCGLFHFPQTNGRAY